MVCFGVLACNKFRKTALVFLKEIKICYKMVILNCNQVKRIGRNCIRKLDFFERELAVNELRVPRGALFLVICNIWCFTKHYTYKVR